MTIGTKSVLYGAHQFLLHPILLAIGWWIEYGFRAVTWDAGEHGERPLRIRLLDPRLWLAFVVHDLGYLGKPNMDGPEGETHPEWGARFMTRICGRSWGRFCLAHSRYYAKRLGMSVSPLCRADKRVIIIEPSWLYLPRVRLSGELAEYLAVGAARAAVRTQTDNVSESERAGLGSGDARLWHHAVKSYMRRWIAANASGPDTWTRHRHALPTPTTEDGS